MLRSIITGGIALLALFGTATAQQTPKGQTLGTQTPKGVNFDAPRYHSQPWFSEPGVRQQLKLTDEQYNKLNQSYGAAYKNLYEENPGAEGAALTPQQRQERMLQNYNTFHSNLNNAGQTILTPEQYARYNQMWNQYRGYDSLLDATNRQKLNLTDAQIEQLRNYNSEYNKKMATLYQQYGADRDAALKGYSTLQPNVSGNINRVLTEEQRRQWSEITGNSYQFQPFYGYNVPKS